MVELWGAGSGGGNNFGGRAGGYGKGILTVSPGLTYSVNVGAGGNAFLTCNSVTSWWSTSGGNTTFGSLYANGGSGNMNIYGCGNTNNGISNATFNITGAGPSGTVGGVGVLGIGSGANSPIGTSAPYPSGGNGLVILYY
jgi:hypothetical protein